MKIESEVAMRKIELVLGAIVIVFLFIGLGFCMGTNMESIELAEDFTPIEIAGTVDEAYCLSIELSEANSISEAARFLREQFGGIINARHYADIMVRIGDKKREMTFEEFFEKLGFKDDN